MKAMYKLAENIFKKHTSDETCIQNMQRTLYVKYHF